MEEDNEGAGPSCTVCSLREEVGEDKDNKDEQGGKQ